MMVLVLILMKSYLVSMRERAELLHGSFELASVPGKGTQVTAVIPIPVGEKTSACY